MKALQAKIDKINRLPVKSGADIHERANVLCALSLALKATCSDGCKEKAIARANEYLIKYARGLNERF